MLSTPANLSSDDLATGTREAALQPTTFDAEKRTVDVIFSTGQRVVRGGFYEEPWIEDLPLNGLDLSALNAGAHVLAQHGREKPGGLSNVIGAVVPGSAKVERMGDGSMLAMATVRLSAAPEDASIVGKIQDGIIRLLSYGYDRIGKPTETHDAASNMTVRTWAKHLARELSFVMMPADTGTGTRAAEEAPMAAPVVTPNPAATEDQIKAAVAEGMRQEAKRQADIRTLAGRLHLPEATWMPMLDAGGPAMSEAREALLVAAAERASEIVTHPQITMGTGEREKIMDAMTDALIYRAAPVSRVEPSEASRDFVHMRMVDLARECLARGGMSGVSRLAPSRVLDLAMGYAEGQRYHSTSDFPLLLANALNKNLRNLWSQESLNYMPICQQRNLPDFKQARELNFGSFTTPVLIPEGGTVSYGTIGETQEVWNLLTYGVGWRVTRQALVNDDLTSFDQVPRRLLAGVTRLQLDLFWALLTANAALSDGVALFAAGHANLAAGADVDPPTALTMGAMRESFRLQTDIGGRFVNLQPTHLIIPAALETAVEQLTVKTSEGGSQPTSPAGVVPRFVGTLAVIAEPRLDANSSTRWYAASSAWPSLICGYLEGASEPQLTSDQDFDTRGVKFQIGLDYGVGVTDHRGLYMNDGT